MQEDMNQESRNLLDSFLEFRIVYILLFEVLVIIFALYLAFLIRYDFNLPVLYVTTGPKIIAPVVIIKLAIFWKMGLLRGWWRYASLSDVIDIFKATVVASVMFTLYMVFAYRLEGIPRSVLLLDWLFTFCSLVGARLIIRMIRERYLTTPRFLDPNMKQKVNTLIIGAGETGQTIVKEIRKNRLLNNLVVGFIDDDPMKVNGRFQGLPVLGGHADIASCCRKYKIEEIIIAIPSATAQQMRTIVECCQKTGVSFKTLPGISDLIDGKVSVQQIREVDVCDLLGRRPVQLDTTKIDQFLKGKKILVTGAAGSIGSEICRQLTRYAPAEILLLDIAESPLFYIEQELLEMHPQQKIATNVCDIRNNQRVVNIIDGFKPQVIFHAAAYKHVPLMEKNPAEAVSVNILGTQTVADSAVANNVESFVMISTDKAVNPTNVMGATKRVAEIYIQTLAPESTTRFTTVRFGNVLGSSGSVVPIFKEQIRKGGPVKVTHPDVTRFFMTIPEATQLVLQAGSMGRGGEVFLLDMGTPVKIVRLAEELIRLSGFTPNEDIKIEFTGLRPGEKLYEELLLAGEDTQPTSHESIHVAKAETYERSTVLSWLERLYQLQVDVDSKEQIELLKQLVPEYVPDKVFWG